MNVLLLFPSDDGHRPATVPNAAELIQDLDLDTLLAVMAGGDATVLDESRRNLLSMLVDPEVIAYRQQALTDCLWHRSLIRELYAMSVHAVEGQRRGYFGFFRDDPDSNLGAGVRLLEFFLPSLRRLRAIADQDASGFDSPAFRRFFATLRTELSDEYLDEVVACLHHLQPRRGVELAASVGRSGDSVDYQVLPPPNRGWRERVTQAIDHSAPSFRIAPRDDAGFHALADMRGRGINRVANAVAQSADHVRSFFAVLRGELAFFIGCINLQQRLEAKGEPTRIPQATGLADADFAATGLYDVCLSLHLADRAVGNDVDADGIGLIVVTGANQGGKSTLLRSIGLAQLMMQCGMFVAAQSMRANVVTGLFTHYRREEDSTMEKGKLEEELSRMSGIADVIGPGALLLCNESFASTNEREGSEIGRRIVCAMTDAGVKVVFVTHLYHLAHTLEVEGGNVLFLRAERTDDGRRTFKVRPGHPMPTSYGQDLYQRIFAARDTALPELTSIAAD